MIVRSRRAIDAGEAFVKTSQFLTKSKMQSLRTQYDIAVSSSRFAIQQFNYDVATYGYGVTVLFSRRNEDIDVVFVHESSHVCSFHSNNVSVELVGDNHFFGYGYKSLKWIVGSRLW